ncbi:hypothetical protein [Pseudoalteromonas prydzensis]|uniref:hypothetical protein n=1 Tax=Pseudoalteromonas prydzensis TaxID=182141 RepID=UPI0007E519B0|nr:hypothetical protein [Pseudoalteromonas prydzensis]MBE0380663.1 hypothetical protein [Pseudoalteromonas prydzensis ACAM 620]
MSKDFHFDRLQVNAEQFITEMKSVPFPFGSFGKTWVDDNWPHFTFSRHGVNSKDIKNYAPGELLPQPIRNFAKAWGVWCITQYNNNAPQFALHVSPIKLIELALREEGLPLKISSFTEAVYDRCLSLIKKHHRGLGRRTTQEHLNKLVRWLNSRTDSEQLIPRYIATRHPYRGNTPHYVDNTAEERRRSRIPDSEVMLATAEIFSTVMPSMAEMEAAEGSLRFDSFEKRFVASCCALLMIEPARYGDIFLLERNCVVEKTDDKGKTYVALRYRGSKGHPDFHKAIPETTVPLLKRAVTWLQHMSEPGLVLARFYANPNIALKDLIAGTGFSVPKYLEHAKPISLWQLGTIVGVYDCKPKDERLSKAWDVWGESNKKSPEGQDLEISMELAAVALNVPLSAAKTLGLPSPLTLNSLHGFWIKRQQEAMDNGYRYHLGAEHKGNGKRIPLSSALIVPTGAMTGRGRPKPDSSSQSRPSGIGSSSGLSLSFANVGSWFTRRLTGKGSATSIFKNMGYPEDYSLNSHGFRHWLNTAAQEQGMSDSLIALWSGRANKKTNFVYDNKTEDGRHEHNLSVLGDTDEAVNIIVVPENAAEFRKKTGRNGLTPTLALPDEVEENGEPITSFVFKTAHRMRTGYCVQPLELVPCKKLEGLDCVGCNKSCHVKGDLDDLNVLQEDHAIQAYRLHSVIKRRATGVPVDDRWLETHERRYAKRTALLSLLTDNSIEDGAVIRAINDEDNQYLVTNAAMTQSITILPHLPDLRERLEAEELAKQPIQETNAGDETVYEFCPEAFLAELMES